MSDPSARSDELDKLRAAAALQLSNARTPEAIEAGGRILAQVTEIEKLAADAEKARAEKQKLELESSSSSQRTLSEERRHIATLLAPLLTTVVLAGTLVLQTYTAITTERDKQVEQQRQREAAEDASWGDTLKSLSGEIKGISPGSLSLNRFFASPRYSQLAKQASISVLLQTNDEGQFKQLFAATFGVVSWANLDEILGLDRQMLSKNTQFLTTAYKKLDSDPSLSPDEQARFDFFYESTSFICLQIAPALRSPRSANFQLDVTYVAINKCDLFDADFSGAKLNGFNPSNVRFDRADFSGASGYDNVSWAGNVWWRARKIDAGMLDYLKKNFPYDPKRTYWNESSSLQQDYDDNVRRLSSTKK